MKHEILNQPWVKIGTDLFSFVNKDYVIHCVKTVNLRRNEGKYGLDKTSYLENFHVVIQLDYTFFFFLWILRNDNGPKFTSYEYKTVSQEWDCKDITSGPRYPKWNGFVERNIQTVKRAPQQSLRTGDIGRTLGTLVPKFEITNNEISSKNDD